MNTDLNAIRQVLSAATDELKACKTHLRGINAYRTDADGLAFAINKFQTAACKLLRVAEDLDSLAADLAPISTSAATANADNGRETETGF
jgi:hypothetical protein